MPLGLFKEETFLAVEVIKIDLSGGIKNTLEPIWQVVDNLLHAANLANELLNPYRMALNMVNPGFDPNFLNLNDRAAYAGTDRHTRIYGSDRARALLFQVGRLIDQLDYHLPDRRVFCVTLSGNYTSPYVSRWFDGLRHHRFHAMSFHYDDSVGRQFGPVTHDKASEPSIADLAEATTQHKYRGLYEDTLFFSQAGIQKAPKNATLTPELWSLYHAYGFGLIAAGKSAEGESLIKDLMVRPDISGLQLVQLHYMYAMLLTRFFSARDYHRAEQLEREAINRIGKEWQDADFYRAFHLNALALIVMRQGRLSEAESLCGEALDLVKDRYSQHESVVTLNLGRLAEAQLNFQEAQKYYDQVIAMDPLYEGAYMARGDLFCKTEAWESALEDYDTVIDRLGVPSPEALQKRSRALRAIGHTALAIADARISMAVEPSYENRFNTAAELHEMGAIEDAIRIYRDLSKTRSGRHDPELYANLAVLYIGKNEWRTALRLFERAHRLTPEHVDITRYLLWTVIQVSGRDAAEARFRELALRSLVPVATLDELINEVGA